MAKAESETPAWFGPVQASFHDKALCSRILQASQLDSQVLPQLFSDMAHAVSGQNESNPNVLAELPGSKKRKLEDGGRVSNGDGAQHILTPVRNFSCEDVSFQIPARKKLRLEVVYDAKLSKRREVRLVNPASGAVEYALQEDQIALALCLPVPDKQARQANFVLYPHAATEGSAAEPIVFTVSEKAVVGKDVDWKEAIANEDTYVTVVERALNKALGSSGVIVVCPKEAEFASSKPQPHRKGEKAFHVPAHRGSKEGICFDPRCSFGVCTDV